MTKCLLTGILFASLAFVGLTITASAQEREKWHVVFTSMHVNDCAEIGACYWRLFCGVRGDDGPTLLWEGEGDTNSTVAIDRILVPHGDAPIDVTCETFEYDGSFTTFDTPVWELVGSSTLTLPEGFQEMRLDQNPDEGDVTVKLSVDELVHISTPIEPPPPPPPPAAATGCRADGPGVCGSVDITCDRPLPVADQYHLSGVGIAYHAAPDIGAVFVEYMNEGNFTASLCATNRGGTSCSNDFNLELGNPVCWHDPAPPALICPTGMVPCGDTCKTPNQCGIWRSIPR
jgi:hypothetical protein